MEAINKSMAKGAVWMILFRLVNRSIGLVSTVILARLLVPADFGLVALATAMTGAVTLLGQFNMDVVLIQNQAAERAQYDTAWTINVIVGAVLAAILLVAGPVAASFYSEPRLKSIIYVLALGTFFQGMSNIGTVEFRKQLAFHKDFYFRLATRLIAFATTVTLAVMYRSYWALVIGGLVSRLMGVVISYYIQPYRPRFSLAAWRGLFHFSKWLFVNNGLNFANGKSADLIIGVMGGPHGLGVYTVGYEISNLTSTELVAPINRAIFPGYAKLSHDLAALRQAFLNVISSIALFALPIGIGIALTAEPLVRLLLGEKWVETIPLIQILAFSGIVAVLQGSRTYVYLAMGRPRIVTLLAGVQVAFMLPALLVGIHLDGIDGAAWAILAVRVGLLPLNFAILFKILQLKAMRLLGGLWRPLAATTMMATAVNPVIHFFATQHNISGWIAELAVAGGIGAVAYLGSLALLWLLSGRPEGVETAVVRRLWKRLKDGINNRQSFTA